MEKKEGCHFWRTLFLLCSMFCFQVNAQDFRIPNKEIVIYLDNSASIVRDTLDAPSQQLASMLIELFSPETGLLNDNDRLSVLAFGPSFTPQFTRLNMVAKDNEWRSLIDNFGIPRIGDDNTDFSVIFRDIQQRIERTEDPDALRIFIIASDFVHDPNNNVRSNKLNSSKSVTALVNRLWRDVQGPIQALKSSSSENFIGVDGKNFLLLLKTDPYIIATSNDFYKTASRDLGQLVSNALANDFDASIINYTPGLLSADAFAETIKNKLTRWISIEIEGIIEKAKGTIDVRLKLLNPNTFPVQLTEIGIALNDRTDPIPIAIPPMIINPGDRNQLTLENLDPRFQQDHLFLYPKQNPEPQGLRKASQASGLRFSDVEVEDLRVTCLMSNQSSLLIEVDVSLPDNEPMTADFLLIRNGTDPTEYGRDRFLLESSYILNASNGQGRAQVYLQLKDSSFEYDDWKQFNLTLVFKGQTTPLLKKYPLSKNSHHPVQTYPGISFIVFSISFLIILFIASHLTTPSTTKKGIRDPLFWIGFLAFSVSFIIYWFKADTLKWHIIYLSSYTSSFVAALIFFRYRISRFSQNLEHLADKEVFIPEERQFIFILINMFFFFLIWLVLGYVISINIG